MTVGASEFIRRFLMHILPEGFVKIRHYGILSNRNRNKKLKACKEFLGVKEEVDIQQTDEKADEIKEGVYICPICKKGHMISKEELISRKILGVGSRYIVAWGKAQQLVFSSKEGKVGLNPHSD